MSKPFVEPPLRGYGIMGKVTLGDEVLKVLRLDGARSIEDAAIRSMLDETSREVWDHDGVCACGKKTYLCEHLPVSRVVCAVMSLLDCFVQCSDRNVSA